MKSDGLLPNLGGVVPPDEVVGRDELILRMWRILEKSSIVLVAERRIGKTTVVKKMAAEPKSGWHPVYLVVEGVQSPEEFVDRIHNAIAPILSKKERVLTRLSSLWKQLHDGEFGNFKLPAFKQRWKDLLTAMLQDIAENFDDRVVFFWDELPLMVSNIAQNKEYGPQVAMELLDTLRDFRVQDSSGKLRMVYTGSVGLHLVLNELRQERYMNDPTNDMGTESLGGLGRPFAIELSCRLLKGLQEQYQVKLEDEQTAIAERMAELTDGLPFHINHLAELLSEDRRPLRVADVDAGVEKLLLDPDDKNHFNYYVERIEVYYLFEEHAADVAFAILDRASRSVEPVAEEELWQEVVSRIPLTNDRLFKKVLGTLERDHYIVLIATDGSRSYRFKYGIIRRWWRKRRG